MPDVPVHFIADQRTNNQWSQYMYRSSCSLKRYFDKKECGMKGVLYFKCASFWSSILD